MIADNPKSSLYCRLRPVASCIPQVPSLPEPLPSGGYHMLGSYTSHSFHTSDETMETECLLDPIDHSSVKSDNLLHSVPTICCHTNTISSSNSSILSLCTSECSVTGADTANNNNKQYKNYTQKTKRTTLSPPIKPCKLPDNKCDYDLCNDTQLLLENGMSCNSSSSNGDCEHKPSNNSNNIDFEWSWV